MTDVAAITAFLEKCLAGDEQIAMQSALAAGTTDGTPDPQWTLFRGSVGASGGVVATGIEDIDETVGVHIARWDPAHVLAEVETKRAILGLHMTSYAELDDGTRRYFCQDRQSDPDFNGDLWAPCLTARLLAAPYAGRQGWDEKWVL